MLMQNYEIWVQRGDFTRDLKWCWVSANSVWLDPKHRSNWYQFYRVVSINLPPRDEFHWGIFRMELWLKISDDDKIMEFPPKHLSQIRCHSECGCHWECLRDLLGCTEGYFVILQMLPFTQTSSSSYFLPQLPAATREIWDCCPKWVPYPERTITNFSSICTLRGLLLFRIQKNFPAASSALNCCTGNLLNS